MGAELVIDRAAEGFRFWTRRADPGPGEWRRFGERIRELTGGDDPDIVFEHPGRETFGASVYVAKRGGTIVTCASTSGFLHQYDNRYLWMHLKRIVGSHFANYREAWEANRLVARGRIHPTVSKCTRWSRPARPRTRCTATRTRARSACSAWRRPRGSASATRSCAPGTRRRSTASAATEHAGVRRTASIDVGRRTRDAIGVSRGISDHEPVGSHAVARPSGTCQDRRWPAYRSS